MKKTITYLLLLLVSAFSYAQKQSKMDIALRHLEQNSKSMGLVKSDYDDMLLNFQSTDENGITYLFFNQTINGTPIKSAILNYTIAPDGKVAFIGNTFIPNKMDKVEGSRNKISAERAFNSAALYLGYTGFKAPNVSSREGEKVTFEKSSICDNNVTAEFIYDHQNGKIIPTWELTMDMSKDADYWQLRVNANDASFVSKNNLTIYCTHHHGKYAKHHNCEANTASVAEERGVAVEDIVQGKASYRVFPLPGESPTHTSHQLVTDPHFPEVSPFGWHDTNGVEGAEHTITKGNNVEAYTDKDDDDDVDTDEAQPDGGAELLFDYPHDPKLEPTSSSKAAQTNLFYMVNMMHDISALYGFTEEWKNFQTKNYTNKGQGNDYVLAQAFDGFGLSTKKLDNANFSTPPDGSNGRMQMFLWTAPGGGVKIDKPAEIAGFVSPFGTAQFGDPIPLFTEPAITGSLIVATDTDLSNPTACCKPITTDLTGKIALIDRGLCNFSQKTKLAEDKGAIAVVICNIAGVNGGTGDEVINMSAGTVVPNKIPTIMMRKSDCDRIRVQLANKVEVTMTLQEPSGTGPRYLDGALDNGIIAHEFGHGISTRLTGVGCLGNGEQMGEGWSDFFSLITTVEPGDKGTDQRGIGTYAEGQNKTGRGIRRFPYSTNMTINPQTFDDIKGNQDANGVVSPHPVGEIWTDCLWDLYWSMVDEYGYDANWKNFESGNAKTLKLVIQALKIQGCNPGFVRGRNAILAADSLLYGGKNGYKIWDVFARRGLGFYADGGSENDINDGVENFETNPYKIPLLKIKKSDFTVVVPGTEFDVTMQTVSHVPEAQTGVVIKDEIPANFTYVNNSANVPATFTSTEVALQLGEVKFNQTNGIKYKLRANNIGSKRLKLSNFEGFDPEWEIDVFEGTTTFLQTDVAQKSGVESYYIENIETEMDAVLISPSYSVAGDKPALRIWHRFDTEAGSDGGFIEISTDGGSAWQVVRDGFIKNGYNSELAYATFAIPNLRAFTGTTDGKFIDSYLDLTPWKGQEVKFRFRFGSDANTASTAVLKGWFIDDVELMDLVVYETKACVANASNANGSCSEIRKIVMDSDFASDVKDLVNIDSYSVYPNPANDYIILDINAKNTSNMEISLNTIDGRNVYSKDLKINVGRNTESIMTNALQSGIYLLQLKDGNAVTTHKVIIQ